jgi:hypothetical protein
VRRAGAEPAAALRMDGGEEHTSASAAEQRRPPPQIRVVRCPKCDKLLPELPNYSVYVCGGCGATLQGTTAPIPHHPLPLSSFYPCNVIITRFTSHWASLCCALFTPMFLPSPHLSRPIVESSTGTGGFLLSPVDSRTSTTMISFQNGFVGTAAAGWTVCWDADTTSSVSSASDLQKIPVFFLVFSSFQRQLCYPFYFASRLFVKCSSSRLPCCIRNSLQFFS